MVFKACGIACGNSMITLHVYINTSVSANASIIAIAALVLIQVLVLELVVKQLLVLILGFVHSDTGGSACANTGAGMCLRFLHVGSRLKCPKFQYNATFYFTFSSALLVLRKQ